MKRLIANHHYVQALNNMLENTTVEQKAVARFVRMIILDHMWKRRLVKELGRKVFFDDFGDFVRAPPPLGLGTSIAKLRCLCLADPHAIQLIERLTNGRKTRGILGKAHQPTESLGT